MKLETIDCVKTTYGSIQYYDPPILVLLSYSGGKLAFHVASSSTSPAYHSCFHICAFFFTSSNIHSHTSNDSRRCGEETTTTMAERVSSSIGPSASTSILSKARHFSVGGNIHINSPQYVHNAQDKSIDGIII